MLKFLNKKTQKMSAALMAGAMVGTFADIADALASGGSGNLNKYLGDTSQRVNQVPDAVAFISYCGGTVLAGLGLVSLKQHVEQGSQHPMKDGLAKLGFGGCLLALPTITDTMMGTGEGSGEAAYKGFTGSGLKVS